MNSVSYFALMDKHKKQKKKKKTYKFSSDQQVAMVVMMRPGWGGCDEVAKTLHGEV